MRPWLLQDQTWNRKCRRATSLSHCPYCRGEGEPSAFATRVQLNYGKQLVGREALKGAGKRLRDAFGLDASGSRRLVSGPISIDMSMNPMRLPHVHRPLEEELRRDVTCPHCGLEHTVFGLATWCPSCGEDVFLSHLAAEIGTLRRVLDDVPERRKRLGARVAARDIENALEDLVSVLEAVLKLVTRRYLESSGMPSSEIDKLIETNIRSGFQNLNRAQELVTEHTGRTLGNAMSVSDFAALTALLEKHHPIAHNLGVIDKKYLTRVRSGELTGREVRVSARDLGVAIDDIQKLLEDLYTQLFTQNKQQ